MWCVTTASGVFFFYLGCRETASRIWCCAKHSRQTGVVRDYLCLAVFLAAKTKVCCIGYDTSALPIEYLPERAQSWKSALGVNSGARAVQDRLSCASTIHLGPFALFV